MDIEKLSQEVAKRYKQRTGYENFLGDVKKQLIEVMPIILEVLEEKGYAKNKSKSKTKKKTKN